MNVFSAFNGIGCASYVLQQLGIVVNKYYASEIDPRANIIATKNYPKTIHFGDITKIKAHHFLDKVDFMCGGSPCQDLSIAGKMAGLDGSRSRLFFEFIRLWNELKPKYFFFENVAGCGKFTQKFICNHCGKEVARNTVHGVLKEFYTTSSSSQNLQPRVQTKQKKTGTSHLDTCSQRERERVQPKNAGKKQGQVIIRKEGILSAKQGFDKTKGCELSQVRQVQKDERGIYKIRPVKRKEITLYRKSLSKNGTGFELREICKDDSKHETAQIPRIQEIRYAVIARKTGTDGEYVSDLPYEEKSSTGSYNSSNEGRQKHNRQSTASMRKMQPDKRQQVDVLCDKCRQQNTFGVSSTDIMSALFGCEPIYFDSALVSPQTRKRLYWTNLVSKKDFVYPEDRGIVLNDVLEFGEDVVYSVAGGFKPTSKANTIDSNYFKGLGANQTRTGVKQINPSKESGGKQPYMQNRGYDVEGKSPALTSFSRTTKVNNVNPSGKGMNGIVHETNRKAPTLTTNKGEDIKIITHSSQPRNGKGQGGKWRLQKQDGKAYCIDTQCTTMVEYADTYRKLTPIEVERCFSLPDDYTKGISTSARYHGLGNGWECATVAEFFKYLPQYKTPSNHLL